MKSFASQGLRPDFIVFSGDCAYSGKEAELSLCSAFFDSLLAEVGLSRDALFVVPGNHDVDRSASAGLARTLDSQAMADGYFSGTAPLIHAERKQRAFFSWYNSYFSGIRSWPLTSSCSPYEEFVLRGTRISILLLNTAAFCLDDNDEGKLWVGRRCIESALLEAKNVSGLRIAVMHHPLSWLSQIERANITSALREGSDIILRGHLHEPDIERTEGLRGSALHFAAGASYQGSQWPNTAAFFSYEGDQIGITPIRFENHPTPQWVRDHSLYPDSSNGSGHVQLFRADGHSVNPPSAAPMDKLSSSAERGRSEHPNKAAQAAAEKALAQDLFVRPDGTPIYVDPRLSRVPQDQSGQASVSLANESILSDLINSSRSFLVNCPSEYGGTTLGKAVSLQLIKAGVAVETRDANSLPNYRAKLKGEFASPHPRQGRVLILDNFHPYRHERLAKEIESIDLFERYIFVFTPRGVVLDSAASIMQNVEFEQVHLWSMGRPEVRQLAEALLDTGDSTYVSNVVEKVYGDLISLTIPLTPANVVMYVNVLRGEIDFLPFNRVDIVNKYLATALSGSRDLVSGAFTSREKIDILAEFAYGLFVESAGSFSNADWVRFCDRYMAHTISSFSSLELLRALEDSRIVLFFEERYYFKYRFYFSFLVGLHLSRRASALADFLQRPDYYAVDGVMETLSALSGDSSLIVERVLSDLEGKLVEFSDRYIPPTFDPLAKAEWVLRDEEEAKVWEKISEEVEAGPVPAQELDIIRGSLAGEAKTADQGVQYNAIKTLEYEVFRKASNLREVLKASHGVRGDIKRRALSACLHVDLIMLQLGIILSPEIAKRNIFQWGGIAFIGFKAADSGEVEQELSELKVVSLLPSSVAVKSSREVGSKKLGELFKVMALESDPESFTSLLLFSGLVQAKPQGWVAAAEARISKIGKKSFYLAQMVTILTHNYKEGANSLAEADSLKNLIAMVYAKRQKMTSNPGSRLIASFRKEIESKNLLGED